MNRPPNPSSDWPAAPHLMWRKSTGCCLSDLRQQGALLGSCFINDLAQPQAVISQGFHRGFTAAEKTELWDRWRRGESLKAIGRVFSKLSSSIYFQLAWLRTVAFVLRHGVARDWH